MEKLLPTFHLGAKWTINNGNSVSFLHGNWLPSGPISLSLFGPFHPADSYITVQNTSNFASCFGEFQWNLPDDLLLSVETTLPLADPSTEDSLSWNSPSGAFTMKFALALLQRHPATELDWTWIWKTATLPKIQFFLWLLSYDRIPTRAILCSRGIPLPLLCPRCNLDIETPLHALRDCPFISPIWNSLNIPPALASSFGLNTFPWLETNCRSKLIHSHPKLPWSSIFCFLLWHIWIDRNNLCFNNNSNPHLISTKALGLAAEFWSAKNCVFRSSFPSFIPVKWHSPPTGWMKLNSDGSAMGNPGPAGAGGLIRDEYGNWIIGYARKIGTNSNNMAELWGVRIGLEIAVSKRIDKLEIETDSMFAKTALTKNTENTNSPSSTLINSCRSLIQQLGQVRISHTYREANGAADCLAKHAAMMEEHFSLFDSVPDFCLAKFTHDRAGSFVFQTTSCKT